MFSLALYILKNRALTTEEANALTEVLLKDLSALPLGDIIKVDDQQQLVIKGVPMELDKAIQLREYAIAALNNPALKLIRSQVDYTAITVGVHKAETPTQMLFARAALWVSQQYERYLEILAQKEQQPPL